MRHSVYYCAARTITIVDETARSSERRPRSEAPPVVNPRDRTTGASVPDDSQYRVLVPHSYATPLAEGRRRVRIATAVAAERGGDVLIAGLPQVPAETPLDEFSAESPAAVESREAVDGLVSRARDLDAPAHGVVWLAYTESRAIEELVERYDCAGVVTGVPTDRSHRQQVLSGEGIENLIGGLPCDVYLERLPATDYAIDRVLLAVAGGPHSALATDTARLVADHIDAAVHAVRVLEPDATDGGRRAATELLEDVSATLDGVRHETRLVEAEDVAEQLIEVSNDYDLTVLGGPTVGALRRFVFGSVPDSVIREGEHAVLMVKHGGDG